MVARASWSSVLCLLAACSTPASQDGGMDAATDGSSFDAVADVVEAGADALPPNPHASPFITDRQGRALILHGVNVDSAAKGNAGNLPNFTEADAVRFEQRWGFNLVRFLIFWSAIEPSQGMFDDAYLATVRTRLDWYAAHHVMVLLDMHQDVYSQRFCCDGAPTWAIHDDGRPFMQQTLWSANYLQPAVMRAFDNFWSYSGEHRVLQDEYVAAWRKVVRTFASHPAVVGYDIMNEPAPGSAFDPLELTGRELPGGGPSGTFDRGPFAEFYARVIAGIRAEDPDGWIFFEPRYAAPANGSRSWIPRLDDPRDGPDHLVYSPHYYSVRLEASGRYDTTVDRSLERWVSARREDLDRQGCPLVLGEFGGDFTYPGAPLLMQKTVDALDGLMGGWAYWSWDPGSWGFWDPVRQQETALAAVLVRPYPQRIAGTPVSFAFDRETRVLRLAFDERAGVTGPTEIYVSAARTYPGGWRLVSDVADDVVDTQFDTTREVLSVTTRSTNPQHRLRLVPAS